MYTKKPTLTKPQRNICTYINKHTYRKKFLHRNNCCSIPLSYREIKIYVESNTNINTDTKKE